MRHFMAFNPEHDLALANGDRHFIAPKSIREMACDLAPLLKVINCNHSIVWGWDAAIKEQLLRRKIPFDMLPSDVALVALRTHSGRKTAHHILQTLRSGTSNNFYEGESYIIRHIDEIDDYAVKHQHIILKDPLSSSGKGLRHINTNDGWNKAKEWANALIRRHGYLTAEPFYHKEQDFAMEFYATGNQCHFIGYSLFTTNNHGRYDGNILLPDEQIEIFLSQYVHCAALHELQAWIINHRHLIIPSEWDTTLFPLHFGIDMMIIKAKDSTYKIHPCVEINLRLNMGIIAHEAARQYLAPEVKGLFKIAFFPDSQHLLRFHEEQKERFPAKFQEDRLVKGYLPLTPISKETKHHAYIICTEAV